MKVYETQSEYVLAKVDATTREDLERLAARLSESGTRYRIWRNRQGELVVYADAYAEPMGLVEA